MVSYVTQNIEQAKKLHSSFVVFYFVFVLWLFLDVSRGTVFFYACVLHSKFDDIKKLFKQHEPAV
ncbi:hypothetical protein I090019C5_23070 [Phocaeicola massiliensis]